jgi:molybdate transport system ATP-binding protein
LPGRIAEIECLKPPYVRVTLDIGKTRLHTLVTRESVDRLALVPELATWAMIKAVAITGAEPMRDCVPHPRPWPSKRKTSPETR